MQTIIDTNYLGKLCKPPQVLRDWLKEQGRDSAFHLAIPDIVDYELRRELIRVSRKHADPVKRSLAHDSLKRLDLLRKTTVRLRASRRVLDYAASLWADQRGGGDSRNRKVIDIDAIVASHYFESASLGNVQLLSTDSDFTKKYKIQTIDPIDSTT